MYNFVEAIPLSLYIHLPWCVRKCPYCDFNSHAVKTSIPEQVYIARLLEDLMQDLPQVAGRSLTSIFIGGGTPSLFSGNAIAELLAAINNHLSFEQNIEITLEANPGTVDEANFKAYHAAGVNRLSLGVQSFQSDKLQQLGRIHDAKAALRAVTTAQTAGFDNINIDLMHGLPEQTVADALFDLNTAIGLGPTHLSWYQLTLEPNTLFHHQPPILPAEDQLDAIQIAGYERLAQANFNRYEISAYSLPDKQCRHNLNYWQFGDYLGIGAGAHGKLTNIQQQQVWRTQKRKHPNAYLDKNLAMLEERQMIAQQQMPFEFMLNALRLEQPISRQLLEARSGLAWQDFTAGLQRATAKKLLSYDEAKIQLTHLGRRFVNDVMAEFLPA